jgi:hypothetical protein
MAMTATQIRQLISVSYVGGRAILP